MKKRHQIIPKGFRAVKTEQLFNLLITELEPDFESGQWVIIDGDQLAMYHEKRKTHCLLFSDAVVRGFKIKEESEVKGATLEQSKLANEQLLKLGYKWTGKTLIRRYKAIEGNYYYFVNEFVEVGRIKEVGSGDNEKMYKSGNYFKTKKEAERRRDLIVWENLRKFNI